MTDDVLIGRQAAIDAIKDLPDCPNGFSDVYDKSCIIGVLEQLPSASPERKKGKWVCDGKPVDPNRDSCWCSACGEWLVGSDEYAVKHNFCPNCGADMRGEKDAKND